MNVERIKLYIMAILSSFDLNFHAVALKITPRLLNKQKI